MDENTQKVECNCHECTQARYRTSFQFQLDSAFGNVPVSALSPHPDFPHQADGDDFPEPHMEAQEEPEESPELAQAVATGELLSMAERIRRAAPFLQLPWDEPSREERNVAANQRNVELALREFIRRRNAALQPKPVDLRRPYCCFIGCQNPPTWQVDAHVGLEDDTQSCDDHLGHLLTDAPLHTVCPIRPVDPRLEKIRSPLLYNAAHRFNLWGVK